VALFRADPLSAFLAAGGSQLGRSGSSQHPAKPRRPEVTVQGALRRSRPLSRLRKIVPSRHRCTRYASRRADDPSPTPRPVTSGVPHIVSQKEATRHLGLGAFVLFTYLRGQLGRGFGQTQSVDAGANYIAINRISPSARFKTDFSNANKKGITGLSLLTSLLLTRDHGPYLTAVVHHRIRWPSGRDCRLALNTHRREDEPRVPQPAELPDPFAGYNLVKAGLAKYCPTFPVSRSLAGRASTGTASTLVRVFCVGSTGVNNVEFSSMTSFRSWHQGPRSGRPREQVTVHRYLSSSPFRFCRANGSAGLLAARIVRLVAGRPAAGTLLASAFPTYSRTPLLLDLHPIGPVSAAEMPTSNTCGRGRSATIIS